MCEAFNIKLAWHRSYYINYAIQFCFKYAYPYTVTGMESEPGLGSIHFFQFNSIPIQVGFRIFQFNSIPIQIGFRIFQFNSNSIHFLSIPIQFNSNFMHRNKHINQIIGYFKLKLNISLFAAQFRKYIIQDHNNSRINQSALVQVLG